MEKKTSRVLLIEDQKEVLSLFHTTLEEENLEILEAQDHQSAMRHLYFHSPDLVFFNFHLMERKGWKDNDLLNQIRSRLPIVWIHSEKEGSPPLLEGTECHHLPQPFDSAEIRLALQSHLPSPVLSKRIELEHKNKNFLFENMGYSEKIQKLSNEIAKVAPTDFSALITGETGTGKELVAHNVHQLSGRSSQKIIALDCGALPATLIESELFGHEKGAFTGADQTRLGKFEAALKGTLFMDEISNLPISLQSKLLRVLQDKTFYRVGGNKTIKADVRIVAATNENLLFNSNKFRKDLYYRLAEFVIQVPPLRERKEDIPFLVNRFIQQTNDELGKNVQGICPSALSLLMDHHWPGNVRELKNTLRKAVLLSRDVVEPEHLDFLKSSHAPHSQEGKNSLPSLPGLSFDKLSLKEIVYRSTITVERSVLLGVLKQTEGNKAEAARILQIDYKTILSKIKKYNLYANGGANVR